MEGSGPAGAPQTVIPAFIAKLWHMVSDASSDELISWGRDGSTFVIKDHNKFSSEMLPMYYKHNNMASFIRQLNMYSFHKVLLVESSSLKNQKELEFYHPHFVKDRPQLLRKIQRKVHHSKEQGDVKCDPAVFNSLLAEVKQLRAVQELFSNKLSSMKMENAALWREHSILRQRHAKQEKIVNKVIHFLISMVQQSSINVSRRKFPLMIKDRPILKAVHKKKFSKPAAGKGDAAGAGSGTDRGKDVNGRQNVLSEDLLLSYNPSEDEDDPPPINDLDIKQEQIDPDYTEPRKGKQSKRTRGSKKRKHEEPLPNTDYLLPSDLVETDIVSPANSSGESVPSPEYVLIDNGEGLVQLLQTGNLPQVLASCEEDNPSTAPAAQISADSAPALSDGESITSSDVITVPGTPTSGETVSQDYLVVPSPVPVVTSPPMPVLSPSAQQQVSSELSPPQLSPGKTLLQLAKPADINGIQDAIKSSEDVETHLDKVQSDLDLLKELLKGEGISLDANMVLELFNENPVSLNMGPPGQASDQPSVSDPDQALMSYTPSLLDLEHDLVEDAEDFRLHHLPPSDADLSLNTPQIEIHSPSFPDPS